MPRPAKTTLFRLFLVLLAFILTYATGEIILAIWLPQPTYSYLVNSLGEHYQTSSVIPFTLKPNYSGLMPSMQSPDRLVTVTTNSFGMRSPQISLPKPEGTQRLLILGDSFTFGVFVSDQQTYPQILQNLYQAQGKPVQVLNSGYTSGWSPDHHYAWLQATGWQFEPDIVIYAFFIGNDINEINPTHWLETNFLKLPTKIVNPDIYVDRYGRLRSRHPSIAATIYHGFYHIPLLRNSHLAIFLRDRLGPPLARFLNLPTQKSLSAHPYPFILDSTVSPELAHQHQLFLKLIQGMAASATAHQAKFMVLMLPINFQVNPRLLPKVVGSSTASINRDYLAELDTYLSQRHIPTLNLLPLMRQVPGEYFPKNGEVHFTPAGHLFTAKTLKAQLDQTGWLK